MKSDSKLLSPQKAVESYLDTLLQEVTEPIIPEQESVPVEETSQNSVDIDDSNGSAPVAELTENLPEVKIQQQGAEKKTPLVIEAGETIDGAIPEQLIESLENPAIQAFHRYDFPMQCLMFSVSGNQLSIPLIDMGSVLPWGAKITPLPHTPEWFLGLLIHREQNVRVVDTATFMQIQSMNVDDENRHILVFGNDSWAMTCDKLGDVIKLNEKDVKWSQQGKAGLMLGTIKSSLAVLLDPEKILLQLNQDM